MTKSKSAKAPFAYILGELEHTKSASKVQNVLTYESVLKKFQKSGVGESDLFWRHSDYFISELPEAVGKKWQGSTTQILEEGKKGALWSDDTSKLWGF